MSNGMMNISDPYVDGLDGEINVVIDDGNQIIARFRGEHALANARQFVAAGEIREALEGLMNEAHSASKPLHRDSEWSIKARAAIAKAKGGNDHEIP